MRDTYITLESFRTALNEQHESTEWFNEVPVLEFLCDNSGNKLTLNFGRGIIIEVPNTKLDSRALEGVLERLQVEGKGFRKLKAEVLAPTLNNFSEVAKGDAEIEVRDGKLFACLSSGATKNDFRHLASSDVLDKTELQITDGVQSITVLILLMPAGKSLFSNRRSLTGMETPLIGSMKQSRCLKNRSKTELAALKR